MADSRFADAIKDFLKDKPETPYDWTPPAAINKGAATANPAARVSVRRLGTANGVLGWIVLGLPAESAPSPRLLDVRGKSYPIHVSQGQGIVDVEIAGTLRHGVYMPALDGAPGHLAGSALARLYQP